MRGLDPCVHDETPHAIVYGMRGGKTSRIAGSSPAMTVKEQCAQGKERISP